MNHAKYPSLLLAVTCLYALMSAHGRTSHHEDSAAAYHGSPNAIALPSGEPVSHELRELPGLYPHGGTLSFYYQGTALPLERAASFFEGGGVSLALVMPEDGPLHLAVYHAAGTEDGPWIYAALAGESRGGLHFQIDWASAGAFASISVNGHLLFANLPLDKQESAGHALFFGDSQDEVRFSEIQWVSRTSETVPTDSAPAQERYREVAQLKDYFVEDKGRLARSRGMIVRESDLFRSRLEKLPPEVRDLPVDKVVFVDNRSGDDSYSGRWPVPHAADGPKATLNAGMDAVPDGGALILMPGYGLYLEEFPAMRGKSVQLIIVGDNDVGTEEEVQRSLDLGLAREPALLSQKLQQARLLRLVPKDPAPSSREQ